MRTAVIDVFQGIQPPVLVFVQSKERAKELFHELIYDGMNVDVIHADRTQLQVSQTCGRGHLSKTATWLQRSIVCDPRYTFK